MDIMYRLGYSTSKKYKGGEIMTVFKKIKNILKPCKKCKGSGTYLQEYAPHGSVMRWKAKERCYRCGGTGEG